MTIEYLKRFKSLVKWLVPFLLAIFLLFGCGNPAQEGNGSKSGTVQAQTSAPVSETESAESGSAAQDIGVPAGKQTKETLEAAVMAVSSAPALEASEQSGANNNEQGALEIEEHGFYTDKESVALYLKQYGRLPGNYITKKQAEAEGWVSKEGNLWDVAPGKSIGGSRYGNYEKKLPEAIDRVWYECDINFGGSYRGPERIIYSNDGLIYYTEDHYQTFEQLY